MFSNALSDADIPDARLAIVEVACIGRQNELSAVQHEHPRRFGEFPIEADHCPDPDNPQTRVQRTDGKVVTSSACVVRWTPRTEVNLRIDQGQLAATIEQCQTWRPSEHVWPC